MISNLIKERSEIGLRRVRWFWVKFWRLRWVFEVFGLDGVCFEDQMLLGLVLGVKVGCFLFCERCRTCIYEYLVLQTALSVNLRH